jgi:hypothetical protein
VNLRTNESELVNSGFFHTAGFPCPDYSSLNVNRGDYSIDDIIGAGARTFNECMIYLKNHDPAVGFYENAMDLVKNGFKNTRCDSLDVLLVDCFGHLVRPRLVADAGMFRQRLAPTECVALLRVVVDNLFFLHRR